MNQNELTTMPLISVVVPIYKVEKYLEQCIDSLVSQTYSNLEIILVDDGSPDSCPEICEKWAEKDKRIIVIHKENGGLSDARNAGIKEATGSYISFIDSDDWVNKSFIQKLYDAIQKEKADIAECSVSLVNEKGDLLRNRNVVNGEVIASKEAIKYLIRESGVYQTVWNKVYKKELIKDIWFLKGVHHEDEFWTYKIMDRTNALALVNESLYYYRQRESSIMGNAYSLKRLEGLQAKFERLKYFGNDPEIQKLCSVKLLIDCLWNLQAAQRGLNKDEYTEAESYITGIVKYISGSCINDSSEKITTKTWLKMFMTNPRRTATLRNKLKIGL